MLNIICKHKHEYIPYLENKGMPGTVVYCVQLSSLLLNEGNLQKHWKLGKVATLIPETLRNFSYK